MLGCHYDFKLHVPEGGELNNIEQGSSFGFIFFLFPVRVAGDHAHRGQGKYRSTGLKTLVYFCFTISFAAFLLSSCTCVIKKGNITHLELAH